MQDNALNTILRNCAKHCYLSVWKKKNVFFAWNGKIVLFSFFVEKFNQFYLRKSNNAIQKRTRKNHARTSNQEPPKSLFYCPLKKSKRELRLFNCLKFKNQKKLRESEEFREMVSVGRNRYLLAGGLEASPANGLFLAAAGLFDLHLVFETLSAESESAQPARLLSVEHPKRLGAVVARHLFDKCVSKKLIHNFCGFFFHLFAVTQE